MNAQGLLAMVFLTTVAAGTQGCAINPRDIGVAPHLTPVGSGLAHERVPLPGQRTSRPSNKNSSSLWNENGAELFRDPRARRIGDILTVKISIDDKASLDNSSNRSRDSNANVTANFSFDFVSKIISGQGVGDATAGAQGATSASGKGAISRSETIDLLVAAVVTDVLPNGNLIISGKQELRVNYELRELRVAGIVRPRDISSRNSVSYDKIAEARISYGGRGRISEVQQPGLVHQVFDAVSPF